MVGAGPAGATAAAILGYAGAKVALIDKATFPRDKACGDLIGPRAVALSQDLGVRFSARPRLVSDMILVGPKGNELVLPAEAGISYPGVGWLMSRRDFDLALFDHAIAAGAEFIGERLEKVSDQERRYSLKLSNGSSLICDALIGADGAISQVARDLALVDETQARYGFAIRAYVEAEVSTPVISLIGDAKMGLFPGYGWLFADLDGFCNVGVGVGVLADRRRGARATAALPGYLELLQQQGRLGKGEIALTRKLGGWLKMGSTGVDPARGRALLVGDAAGLVNPLQGEGIFAAMDSGRAAAYSLLDQSRSPHLSYKAHLREMHLDFATSASVLQRLALEHPKAAYFAANLLTSNFAPGILGSAWGIYWNDLMAGSGPIRGAQLARGISRIATLAAMATPERKIVEHALS